MTGCRSERADDDPGRPIRRYRRQLRGNAQTSPPPIGWAATEHVVGERVADVGCGSGSNGYLLRTAWAHTGSWQHEGVARPGWLVGLDRSRLAARTSQRHRAYDDVLQCDATALPLADGAVDTALCAETVEHLFPRQAMAALGELSRVAARRVIITTPAPWQIIERDWLREELEDARSDAVPLTRAEYLGLGAALHKTWLTPSAMRRAGFTVATSVVAGSLVYIGEPRRLRVAVLGELPGLDWPGYPADDGRGDWRQAYVDLLTAVATMVPRGHGTAERLRQAMPWA